MRFAHKANVAVLEHNFNMTLAIRQSLSYYCGMDAEALTIGDLADRAGVSRRAIRFYVQRGLLPPPEGKGRGSIYRRGHFERLKRIHSLQASGHSLDAIARLVEQDAAAHATEPQSDSASGRAAATLQNKGEITPSDGRITAQLWTRLRLGDGIEIHWDATRYSLPVEKLIELRDAVRKIVKGH